jgi:endonuclease/exonuclease/phosphatase family metal-dependent hydrolase
MFKTLSFNIRYENSIDNGDIWENRKQNVVDFLKSSRADIIALQEVVLNQYNFISGSLIDYHGWGVGRDDGYEKGEFAPIFFKKHSYNLLDKGVFWLSDNPDKPGSFPGAGCPRIVTWVKLDSVSTMLEKQTPKAFFVFNVHFDHLSERVRVSSAHLMLQKINQIAGLYPCIVMGDFNDQPTSDAIKVMTSTFLQNTQLKTESAQHPSIKTFCGFDGQDSGIIDYIFVSGFEVVEDSWKTLEDKRSNGRYLSDHHPIQVMLNHNCFNT